MTESVTSRLVPILCVGAGITTALLIGRGVRQTEAGPDLAVKAEFDQLPAAEQTLVLGKAESLQRRWDANPDEYRRLKDIHDAVTAEPELYDKLVRFHQWWLELDFGQKSQLKSDGQFAVNWPERTQRLDVETQTKPRRHAHDRGSRLGYAYETLECMESLFVQPSETARSSWFQEHKLLRPTSLRLHKYQFATTLEAAVRSHAHRIFQV